MMKDSGHSHGVRHWGLEVGVRGTCWKGENPEVPSSSALCRRDGWPRIQGGIWTAESLIQHSS